MNEKVFPEALAVLKAFFADMRQWQIECKRLREDKAAKKISHEDYVAKALEMLGHIYARYCEVADFPTNIVHYSKPTYDPNCLNVLEMMDNGDKTEFVIERQTILPKVTLKYTLKIFGDQWRLLAVERFDHLKKKYVPYDFLL